MKFAETTVTFQSNHPTTPIQMADVTNAVKSGINTHMKFLNIRDKTNIKIRNTDNPKTVKSCEINFIVSTVIIAPPPKKNSPKS